MPFHDANSGKRLFIYMGDRWESASAFCNHLSTMVIAHEHWLTREQAMRLTSEQSSESVSFGVGCLWWKVGRVMIEMKHRFVYFNVVYIFLFGYPINPSDFEQSSFSPVCEHSPRISESQSTLTVQVSSVFRSGHSVEGNKVSGRMSAF